jgi:pyruvate dehydrogenase E2 component (dihydrolipoamide acetyltransferase)
VVDLGIAMDTPDGLFVPVLRDVGRRTMAELRQDLDTLRTQVKTRGIAPEALRGQTITLSNFGMLGGRHAALVVIPPQVAIVGAGRIAPQVVALEGQPAVRRTLPLSLTFDHRAVTGGEAARFMAALVRDLRTP